METEEFRARSVSYLPTFSIVLVVLTTGDQFPIPLAWIPELKDLPEFVLMQLALRPDGSYIELDSHDIHINVHGLMSQSRVLPHYPMIVRDAKRYRWVREHPAFDTENVLGHMTPEEYDNTVDELMRQDANKRYSNL